jgi:single-strand DNA-binding protein
MLKGNLCADPEVKVSKNGNKFCKFRIGVSRKKNAAGEFISDFFNCTAFTYVADYVGNNLKKGDSVILTGEINIDKVQGKDGKDTYFTNVLCRTVDGVNGKKQSGSSKPYSNDEIITNENDFLSEESSNSSKKTSSKQKSDDIPF